MTREVMAAAFCFAAGAAFAADGPPPDYHCHSLKDAKEAAESAGWSWTIMTPDQWNFARGVAAIAPQTPIGLPPGDSGVLSEEPGGDAAIIFVDGDKACETIGIYRKLADLILSVGRGDIVHTDIGKPL